MCSCEQNPADSAEERPHTPLPNFAGAHGRRPDRSLPAISVEIDPPPRSLGIRHLGVSPSGPRARSWHHGRACRVRPNSPRPRTASGLLGAARYGRPSLTARCTPRPGIACKADDAPGTRPGPGASGDHSPGVPRSGAAGPAPASPPPRSSPPAGGARAASRATATPQRETRRGDPGRAHPHSEGTGGGAQTSPRLARL